MLNGNLIKKLVLYIKNSGKLYTSICVMLSEKQPFEIDRFT